VISTEGRSVGFLGSFGFQVLFCFVSLYSVHSVGDIRRYIRSSEGIGASP